MDNTPSSDVAFSPAVKAIQTVRGSREHYARMERRGGWQSEITPDLAAFIAAQRSFYLATASADGRSPSAKSAITGTPDTRIAVSGDTMEIGPAASAAYTDVVTLGEGFWK